MTICSKFVGRDISSCTRGNACICHDYIEGCDCENCKAHVLKSYNHFGYYNIKYGTFFRIDELINLEALSFLLKSGELIKIYIKA